MISNLWHARRADVKAGATHMPFSLLPLPTAVSSLFAAAKVEEIYPPTASELAETTAGSCESNDITAFERHLLAILDWRTLPPTPYSWIQR